MRDLNNNIQEVVNIDSNDENDDEGFDEDDYMIESCGFQCNKCKREFLRVVSLNNHECAYCETCNKGFPEKWKLNRHIDSVHNGEKVVEKREKKLDVYPCEKCPRKFSSAARLKNHACFYCPECCKSFNTKGSLHHHMKVHEEEKIRGNGEWICQNCPREFGNSTDLNAHTCAICEQCQKPFKSEDLLRCHYKSHKEKEKMCRYCPYKTSVNNILLRHERFYHEEIFDYVCQDCGHKSISKEKLKRHRNSMHLKHRNYGTWNANNTNQLVTG